MKLDNKFTKKQCILVVESILLGVMCGIVEILPSKHRSWKEHKKHLDYIEGYRNGMLESAGNSIASFMGDLVGEGASFDDCLVMAGNFHLSVENLVHKAWCDKGKKVLQRQKELSKSGSYNITTDIYDHLFPDVYPNSKKCAEAFYESLKRNYDS